jgi:hypothetical protein
MKSSGRCNQSFSLYTRHVDVLKRLAEQAGLTPSEILREIIEAVSDCHAAWSGCFLKFEKPNFRWGADESGRYL